MCCHNHAKCSANKILPRTCFGKSILFTFVSPNSSYLQVGWERFNYQMIWNSSESSTLYIAAKRLVINALNSELPSLLRFFISLSLLTEVDLPNGIDFLSGKLKKRLSEPLKPEFLSFIDLFCFFFFLGNFNIVMTLSFNIVRMLLFVWNKTKKRKHIFNEGIGKMIQTLFFFFAYALSLTFKHIEHVCQRDIIIEWMKSQLGIYIFPEKTKGKS